MTDKHNKSVIHTVRGTACNAHHMHESMSLSLLTNTTGNKMHRSEDHTETQNLTRHNRGASWQAPTQGMKADCISRCNMCDARGARRLFRIISMYSSLRSACTITRPPLFPVSLPVATAASAGEESRQRHSDDGRTGDRESQPTRTVP
ncbi:hypothetical protein TcCL_Unassigned01259 [Trypanosoma cruzi]|nr:hypothetical protein TcCL_Unassigned01259 [Trypanosoma cruzi]